MKTFQAAISIIILSLPLLSAKRVSAVGVKGLQFDLSGRFEYTAEIARNTELDGWDYDSTSPADASRLMLNLGTDINHFGRLYLKGSTPRRKEISKSGSKFFEIEQGDVEWKRERGGYELIAGLFKTERRYFTGAMVAPLMQDDMVDDYRDHFGLRVDASRERNVFLTTVLSSLGEVWNESRKVFFTRTGLDTRLFLLSFSYLYEGSGRGEVLKHAVFKSELTWFYKRAALIMSFEQSGSGKNGLIFPKSDFHFDKFLGDNFSSALPRSGAFFSELRIRSIPLKSAAIVDIVHSYFAVGPRFESNLGSRGSDKVGYVFGAYAKSREKALDARIQIGKSVRSTFENERTEFMEGSIRGDFIGGVELGLRGGMTKTTVAGAFVSRQNRLLGTVAFRGKKMRNEIHAMMKNIDTDFRENSFAWSSRYFFNPDFAVNLRTVLSERINIADAVFARLEFRPAPRFYAYLSYGRKYIGDAPVLLEDFDVYSSHHDHGSGVYTISVRGDF